MKMYYKDYYGAWYENVKELTPFQVTRDAWIEASKKLKEKEAKL